MVRRCLFALTLLVSACAYESSGTTTSTTVVQGTEPAALGPAALIVEDQRIEGSSMTVDSVTLPSAGWIVARADAGGTPGELLGISELLGAGTYAGVQIPFFVPVADGALIHLALHIDVDRDGSFTYEPPDSFIDEIAVLATGEPATAEATLDLLPPLTPADVLLADQTTDGTSVTIAEATLPSPGFVALVAVVDGEAGAVLAATDLMEAGTYQDLVLVPDPPLTESTPIVAAVYVDRDENGTFTLGDGGDEVGVREDGSLARQRADLTVILSSPGSITAGDQEGGGALVLIDEIVLPSAGFALLLSDTDGSPGDPITVTDVLPSGTSTNVVIQLPEEPTEDTVYWLRLFVDFDGDGALTDADVAVTDDGGDVVEESFTLQVIQ